MKQLEVYFRQYILKVRGLAPSTADHYAQALRTISSYLKKAGLLVEDIYSVEKLEELEYLRKSLMQIKEFVALDEKGNRMYSVGLNRYIEFAKLQQNGTKEIPAINFGEMDVPVARPEKSPRVTYGWNRDRVIVEQVLKADKYQCEIDPNHKTFITRKNDELYLEGHHLIPISKQCHFEKSLDVYANIIGLCPNCHRQFHFGRKSDIVDVLNKLYNIRAPRLSASGITVSKDEFFALTTES